MLIADRLIYIRNTLLVNLKRLNYFSIYGSQTLAEIVAFIRTCSAIPQTIADELVRNAPKLNVLFAFESSVWTLYNKTFHFSRNLWIYIIKFL